jgi:hypothetical protein
MLIYHLFIKQIEVHIVSIAEHPISECLKKWQFN